MYRGEHTTPFDGAYFIEEQLEPLATETTDLEAAADQFLAAHADVVTGLSEEENAKKPTADPIEAGSLQLQETAREATFAERNDIDQKIVDKAKDGDPGAIEDVARHIHPIAVKYARGKIGRDKAYVADSDDIAQEIVIATLKSLPGFRNDGRPFMAFFYGIAKHKVTDHHRAIGRNKSEPKDEIENHETAASSEDDMLRFQENKNLAAALSTLSDTQREIVTLRVVAGLSAEETAEAVGSTPGAVRVTQHRAIKKMRKFFGEDATYDAVFEELSEEEAEPVRIAPQAKAGPKPELTPIEPKQPKHEAVEEASTEDSVEVSPQLVTAAAKAYTKERPHDSINAAYAAAKFLCRQLTAKETSERLGIRPRHVELYYGDHNPLMGQIIQSAAGELASRG